MLLILAPLTAGAINSACLWVVLREGMEAAVAGDGGASCIQH